MGRPCSRRKRAGSECPLVWMWGFVTSFDERQYVVRGCLSTPSMEVGRERLRTKDPDETRDEKASD